jgi:hypothetical protein
MQGLRHPLRLTLIALEALVRLKATTVSGFGLFFGVSCAGGYGTLLLTGVLAMPG